MPTLHLSVSEYARLFGSSKGKMPEPALNTERKNKHHNRRVYVYEDGFISEEKTENHGKLVSKYDSKKEYNRHCELRLMERAGKISGLKTQVPIIISDEFTDKDGKKHRAIIYRADFVYIEDGKEVVEDVKGQDRRTGKYQTTEGFRLKWKLLQAKYMEKSFKLY